MATLLTRGLRPAVARVAVRALLAVLLTGAAASAAWSQTPPHINPAWLKADSATQTVQFDLIAGLTGANAGMNFNGFENGQLKLTVPVGWHVVVHFKNQDQNLPHSAAVTRAVTPVPPNAGPPAFAYAATHHLESGMASDSHEDFRFTADQVGAYTFFCAVPGHGAAGMWIRFDVSPTVTRPALEIVH